VLTYILVTYTLIFGWVKAHAQHAGNEQADHLAKLGANQVIGPARLNIMKRLLPFPTLF
jgi:ribonuclease HI